MKKRLSKALIIFLAVCTIILIGWGIYILCTKPSTGEDKLLSDVSAVEDEIRDGSRTEPLTDEQFSYGLEHLIPQDYSTVGERNSAIKALCSQIEALAGNSPDYEYLNWFGTPAIILRMAYLEHPELLVDVLNSATFFDRIYLEFRSEGSTNTASEWLFSNGQLNQVIDINNLNIENYEYDVQELVDILNEEYSASLEDINVYGSMIHISASTLESELLNIFDFCYQWCRNQEIPATIVITQHGVLYANAYVDMSSEYWKLYYPAEELAARFRLLFYYSNNYFKNNLQSACKAYF